MPVYEYYCKACDFEFEREQRISEDPIKDCPSCGSRQAKRLISRTSFVLKGGGWYSDLYGSPGSSDDKGQTGEKGEKSGAGADKGDGKSAKKEKSKPKGSGGGESKKGGKGSKAAA